MKNYPIGPQSGATAQNNPKNLSKKAKNGVRVSNLATSDAESKMNFENQKANIYNLRVTFYYLNAIAFK